MYKLNIKELSLIEKKIQISNEIFIALIDTTTDKGLQKLIGCRNIYCINNDNEVLWQVDISKKKEKQQLDDTFVYIKINEKGELQADTFFGFEYLIDMKTGVAEQVGWHK